jgi:hypothetical protein
LLKNANESRKITLSYLAKMFKNFSLVIPEVNEGKDVDTTNGPVRIENEKEEEKFDKIDHLATLNMIG